MSADQTTETRARIRDDFMRRLFAVAISVGFATTFSKMNWVREARLPDNSEINQLMVLSVAFLATIQSWDGYLVSISIKKLHGTSRFTIDIVLVMIYMFLLINAGHYYVLPFSLALIFLLYVVWDFLTIMEHYNQYNVGDSTNTASVSQAMGIYSGGFKDTADISRGPIITLSWFCFFVAFASIIYFNSPKSILFMCIFETIGLMLYRRDKIFGAGKVRGFSMPARAFLVVMLVLITWHASYYFEI